MRLAVWFGFLAALATISLPVHAQVPERSPSSGALLIYAIGLVHNRPLQEPVRGYGIYLGKGAVVITAAHVLGRWPAFITNPRLLVAGRELPARIIKKGSPETTDLALLSVEEAALPMSLRLRLNPLCREPARAGENVIVVALHETAHSQIMFPQLLPPEYRKNFSTFIRDAGVGASGSGVFHADKKCLLGIITTRASLMSYRIEGGRDCERFWRKHCRYQTLCTGSDDCRIPTAGISVLILPRLSNGMRSKERELITGESKGSLG